MPAQCGVPVCLHTFGFPFIMHNFNGHYTPFIIPPMIPCVHPMKNKAGRIQESTQRVENVSSEPAAPLLI